MKTLRTLLLCAAALLAATALHADELQLSSPNGQLTMRFTLTAQGEPTYALSYKGKAVIKPSKLAARPTFRATSPWPAARPAPSTRHGSPYGARPRPSATTTTSCS